MPDPYLATKPFDLYALHLFRLVADLKSFTKAGARAGLTQSAMTRQIQGMEERLGFSLFERSTRSVDLTPAGAFLLGEAETILSGLDDSLRRLNTEFGDAAPTLRVGISHTIGLAYLPGFFNAYQKNHPNVLTDVAYDAGRTILQRIADHDLDVGLVCVPKRLPTGLTVTHRFEDGFSFIAPPDAEMPEVIRKRELLQLAESERWILIADSNYTGAQLRSWLSDRGIDVTPSVEAENFDLIANLVSMGMGVSLVPNRVLPLYGRRRPVQKVPCRPRFSRELAVVVRKNKTPETHLTQFVEEILY